MQRSASPTEQHSLGKCAAISAAAPLSRITPPSVLHSIQSLLLASPTFHCCLCTSIRGASALGSVPLSKSAYTGKLVMVSDAATPLAQSPAVETEPALTRFDQITASNALGLPREDDHQWARESFRFQPTTALKALSFAIDRPLACTPATETAAQENIMAVPQTLRTLCRFNQTTPIDQLAKPLRANHFEGDKRLEQDSTPRHITDRSSSQQPAIKRTLSLRSLFEKPMASISEVSPPAEAGETKGDNRPVSVQQSRGSEVQEKPR